MGVAVAASDPRVVYAMVQAREGGVFRSDDAGGTWKRVNAEMKLRQRAFYYMAIYVDPTNPQIAFVPQVDGTYKSTNGGKTWKPDDAIAATITFTGLIRRTPKFSSTATMAVLWYRSTAARRGAA